VNDFGAEPDDDLIDNSYGPRQQMAGIDEGDDGFESADPGGSTVPGSSGCGVP
jgi:hypothetical protein